MVDHIVAVSLEEQTNVFW